jgi:DNA invertase Pin-like site-specific DNA recombinase
MKNGELRYFIYARKSSEDEDRQVLSLDSQEATLTELAARSGLNAIEIFRESHSAKEPDARPIFAHMIKAIKRGEAEGIICWKLDRLARNPDEAGRIIGMLQRNEILHIQTAEKDYRPEDNSLLSYLEFGIANQYIRDLSNNVKRGLKTKLEMGWFPSRAPLGYLNSIHREKGHNEIVPDPDRFRQVKRMWTMMLAGAHSVSEIHAIATTQWKLTTRETKHVTAKPLTLSMMYRIFTSPFYYGWFEYPKDSGNWFKGKHEPMITEDEFNHVQRMLGRYAGKPKLQTHAFAYAGIMTCGTCGAAITAEEKWKRQKNGNAHYYVYYHCTKRKDKDCPEKYIEEKALEKQIDGILQKFQITDRFKDWAVRFVNEPREDQAGQQEEAADRKQKRIGEIGKQLEAMFVKYTSPANGDGGLIPDHEYRTAKMRLEKEKASLEDDVAHADEKEAELIALSERTFQSACYARAWFNEGDPKTRRAILLSLGSNFSLKGKMLSIDLHLPWKVITDKKAAVEKELREVRTPAYIVNTSQIFNFSRNFLTLRRERDSNPRTAPIRINLTVLFGRGSGESETETPI